MKKIVALFLVLICISSMVGCYKAKYTVEIADNYPIVNRLKPNYAAGEEVTVKLETITEHYYVLSVNGEEVEIDEDASDLTYTYFTFTMPGEDVLIQIEDKWVEIPPVHPAPVDKCSPITLTIVEAEPSGVAFEYWEPNTPYCFYAFDEDENLYRVLWTDWDGLKENDRVIVEYDKLEELTYDEYPDGGWTPQHELTATGVHTANCISKNQGAYMLTLPKSGKQIKLSNDEILFVPYITDALVVAAENKITDDIAEYSNNSGFYLQVDGDDLYLYLEVIQYLDEPKENVGCFDHEHLFLRERIALCSVTTQIDHFTYDSFEQYDDGIAFVEIEDDVVYINELVPTENPIPSWLALGEFTLMSKEEVLGYFGIAVDFDALLSNYSLQELPTKHGFHSTMAGSLIPHDSFVYHNKGNERSVIISFKDKTVADYDLNKPAEKVIRGSTIDGMLVMTYGWHVDNLQAYQCEFELNNVLCSVETRCMPINDVVEIVKALLGQI